MRSPQRGSAATPRRAITPTCRRRVFPSRKSASSARLAVAPVGIREGHAFADTVFGGNPTKVDHTDVPTAVFSEPEIGVIGLTETQARERLHKVDIYKTTFRPM